MNEKENAGPPLTKEKFEAAKLVVRTKGYQAPDVKEIVKWDYLTYQLMRLLCCEYLYVCVNNPGHSIYVRGSGTWEIDNKTGVVTPDDIGDEKPWCEDCKSSKCLTCAASIEHFESLVEEK